MSHHALTPFVLPTASVTANRPYIVRLMVEPENYVTKTTVTMNPLDPTKFTFLPVIASVREFEPTEDNLKAAILAAVEMASAGKPETASVDPIGPNNMPRMLQLSGWLTYAEEVNLNGRLFTKADLEEVVANGMFKAPFFGMIDYNHDFSLYGVWYDTKFAFDEVAQKWGIYGEGVIFAWRFGEIADKMLAMQARNGNIKLSMACMPEWYEPAKTEDGTEYLVARKPVFFTTSVLDVDPAFPNSRAYGSEDPNSTQEQRAAELLKSSLSNEDQNSEVHMKDADKATEGTEVEGTEVAGTEVVTETATEQKAEVVEGEEKQEEASVTETATVETTVEADIEKAEVEQKVEVETPDVAALETKIADLEAQLQTATVALNAAKTELATANEELVSLRTFKSDVETAKAEQAKAERTEARKAELPDAVLAELEKDENKALFDEMMGYDEARWEAAKSVFAVASVGRKSHADKSAEEGTLSGASDKASGSHAISRWTNKNR